MDNRKPVGELRDFVIAGASRYQLDGLGRVFYTYPSWGDQTPRLSAASPDEFFYDRINMFLGTEFSYSQLGGDYWRDLDGRLQRLIGRKL